MLSDKNYCIIMAGGIGSRFWPLSKTSKPKQFLDILGTGKTLIQQTYERFLPFCPKENILIVTNAIYKDYVLEQLPINPNQVLLEPARRNTAPCIAYASYKIHQTCPDANVVVAPSDHLILNIEEFNKEISKGFDFVSKNNALLTLGLKPTRPETGYGYIQVSSEKNNSGFENLKKVKTFTEKPNAELAQIFVNSGEFFWNSGIFIWSLKAIISSFKEHLSEVGDLFEEGLPFYNTPEETNFIQKTYSECRNISIDYGIMEKANNVYVLCTDFGWSDLGTWGSLYENSEKDKKANVINGDNIFVYNSKNCIVKLLGKKIAVVDGLDNFIVVESDGMLLICRKDNEQEIRQFVSDIKLQKGDEYV